MKIIEVRDGFIKFEADKSIYLSSFIQADGAEKSYIAQVSQLQVFGEIVVAKAKILFLYMNGMLANYDRTEPSCDAELKPFTLDILKNSIKIDKPVIIGKTFNNEDNITIDSSAFNKKMLISADNKDIHNTLTRNLTKQFLNLKSNTVILDTLGIINAKKYYAGIDFKLPLNTSTLAFMYESCLNDATGDSKQVIKDIFKDLAEYSETVEFVPFDVLKSIVFDMVDKQHIFKLLVLKNKLSKFDKMGLFASSKNDVSNLDKILSEGCAVLDFSRLDTAFLNKYLEYVYSKLSNVKNAQVFLELANTISKKNLKSIIIESPVSTTFLTHSKFQYLNDIKNLFDNFIIEPGIINNNVFKVYSTFLSSMQKGSFLMAGESVNYIPIVIKSQIIDDIVPYTAEEDITEEDTEAVEPEEIQIPDENNENIEEQNNEMPETAEVIEENDSEYNETSDGLTEITSEDDFADDENIDDSNEEDINIDAEIDLDENNTFSQEELIAEIDEKSEHAISSLAENYVEQRNFDPFGENTENPNDSSFEELEKDNEFQNEYQEEYNDNELLNGLSESDNELSEIADDNNEEVIGDFTDNEYGVEFEAINNFETNEDIVDADELNINDLEEEQQQPAEIITENPEINNEEFPEPEELTSVELDSEEGILIDEAELTEDDYSDELREEQNINKSLDVDLSEPQVMPISGEALNNDFEEIVELDPTESDGNDIMVDISDEENINIDEQTEQQIVEDVDKVYTTIKDEYNLDEFSDTDLDLIDKLNSDEDDLQELASDLENSGSILEEADNQNIEQVKQADILEKRDSSTPIVPVYDADIPQEDTVVSDPIQQGDAVMHAKYGNGVVEKMIKYGNKTLFAINFENIGRRLLDPTLAEIKKV